MEPIVPVRGISKNPYFYVRISTYDPLALARATP
jgi:hypothetical protein